MAESMEKQLSLIEESENEVPESQPSQSLLPQGPKQLGCNEPNESDTSITFTEDSQTEFSGFSENYSSEITDPFDSIFYHMMPSKDSTGIFFYTKPLFNSIIAALDKEFKIPENSFKQFSLKTHVDGKRCSIKVDKVDMTITLSGPGHVCWREKNFKKLTINMFNNFVDETKTVLYTSCNATSAGVPVHDSKNDSTISLDQTSIAHPKPLVELDRESPLMRNISALMDMIHSLQGQVATLTAQMNKLVLEAANSVYRTVDETVISQQEEDVTFNNSRISENLSIPVTAAKRTTQDHPSHAEKASVLDSNLVASKTRLTSTPIPGTSHSKDKIPPTPKSRRQPQPSACLVPSTGPVPSRPVPKPRQSVQRGDVSKQILLIGDSIISGINPKGLKENVHRDGIPGASVDCILKEVKVFDLSQFSHIIIYVGGNNASKGTDTEYFEEKYDQLLDYIQNKNNKCKVLVVSSCPRGDSDTTEVNSIIHRLAEEYQMTFVDAYYAFHNKHGEVIERYYSKDSIHLSTSGIKRLLGTINNFVEIVQNFDQCGFLRRQRGGRPAIAQQRRAGLNVGSQRSHAYNRGKLCCNKCGETNHTTIQCRHSDPIQCHHCGYSGHKSKRCVNK